MVTFLKLLYYAVLFSIFLKEGFQNWNDSQYTLTYKFINKCCIKLYSIYLFATIILNTLTKHKQIVISIILVIECLLSDSRG
jgi:peptidoglycan biosynthesis protein MviN/MurJ (putative lipid II flippase)